MRIGASSMAPPSQPEVTIVNLREDNVVQLKKLSAVLFPITYQEKYYARALASGGFSKLACYGNNFVGCIACRIERTFGGKRLCIMTLGILAPYRRLGIGSKLMENVLDLCARTPEILEVYLHVQTNNEEALEFYKKFGFEVIEIMQNYYKRIDPPDCFLLSKSIEKTGIKATIS
eukprot:c17801_g1_i1 orf=427-951(-)